jgi:predicted MFS family arabinose efflux permease
VGWLASGELFSITISVLVMAVWGNRVSPRRLAAVAALAAIVANLVAMYPSVKTLVLGRLLSGLALGAVVASIVGVAARRPDAQRAFSVMQTATVLLMSVIYFMAPSLIDRFGLSGLFAVLAGVSAAALVTALVGLPAVVVVPTVAARALTGRKFAPLMGCLALAIVFAGQVTVTTYIITIGNELGFDTHTMGTLLAIAIPLAMIGPLAAHGLGERLGLLRPLLLGLALLAIDILFLVNAASPILFGVLMATDFLLPLFCVTYALALLSRFDASGRFATAAPAFMMIGGAVGPALGSRLIGTTGFETLALVAASCMVAGIALFAIAACLTDVKVCVLNSQG